MKCDHDAKYGHKFAKNGCLACELVHVAMLAKQLYEALGSTDYDCDVLHHKKSQYHSNREACPVVKRLDQVMADYEEWFLQELKSNR